MIRLASFGTKNDSVADRIARWLLPWLEIQTGNHARKNFKLLLHARVVSRRFVLFPPPQFKSTAVGIALSEGKTVSPHIFI
jgi:hypothetical protein